MVTAPKMIRIDRVGPAVLELFGEHDVASAPELRCALAEAFEAGKGIVVDLSDVESIDPSVMRLLFDTAEALAGRGRRLVVQIQTASVVRPVLEVTEFPKESTVSSRKDAIALASAVDLVQLWSAKARPACIPTRHLHAEPTGWVAPAQARSGSANGRSGAAVAPRIFNGAPTNANS
jgi:anti-anti-sigma factor